MHRRGAGWVYGRRATGGLGKHPSYGHSPAPPPVQLVRQVAVGHPGAQRHQRLEQGMGRGQGEGANER